jgi:hypothetical protein
MCLGNIERQNRKKYLKIWDDQIKPIISAKKTSHKKRLASKKLGIKQHIKGLSILYTADSNICSAPTQGRKD